MYPGKESKSFFDFPPVLFPEPKTELKIMNVLYVLSVWDCTIVSDVLSTGRCFEFNLIINRLHTLPYSPPLFFAFFRRRDDRILLCCPGCLGTQYSPDWLWTVDPLTSSPHWSYYKPASPCQATVESGKGPVDLLSACVVLCGGMLNDSGCGTSDPPDGEDAAVITGML